MKAHNLLEEFVKEQACQLMTVEEAVKQHRKDHHLPKDYCAKLIKSQYQQKKNKHPRLH